MYLFTKKQRLHSINKGLGSKKGMFCLTNVIILFISNNVYLMQKIQDLSDFNQATAELIAANTISAEKPIVILTDFERFGFFWVAYHNQSELAVFTAWFDDTHVAATFACMVLNPELIQAEIADQFPTYERRVVPHELTVIDEDYEDVGNLDDFVNEMTPLECEAHEINKKLRWLHRHIPPAFCKLLAHKVVVRDGVLENLY